MGSQEVCALDWGSATHSPCAKTGPLLALQNKFLLLMTPQLRIRCTSVIYGDLVHMSSSSCFPYNTKHTSQHSVSTRWVNPQRLRSPAGLSASPAAESSDPSWCVWVHSLPPLPQVVSVHYVETTCVPRAWSKRWKMIWKRHSGNSKQKWRKLSRVPDRQAGLIQHQGPSPMRATRPPPLPTRAQREDGGQPRKWGTRLERRSQDASQHPIVLPIFFGRKTCLFGENEPKALMDNAGEGTLGTCLWERKFEQKQPF